MMTRFQSFPRAAFLLTALFLAPVYAAGESDDPVALITKAINDVTKKSSSGESVRGAAGTILISEDRVQTGKKSFALIKFTDDNSMIRLRELSELTIKSGNENGSSVRKSELSGGALGFDVQKQARNREFRLTSPTSVASIRGTKGKWSGGRGRDTLVVTEGLVNLKNNISDRDVDVPAGYIGFSNDDGSISSRKATAEELADADNAVSGSENNELKLEMRDRNGRKKDLKLRYKQ